MADVMCSSSVQMVLNLNPNRLREGSDILANTDAPGTGRDCQEHAAAPHRLLVSFVYTKTFPLTTDVAIDIGGNLQALGVLAQLAALGCRFAVIRAGSEFLKDKKASRGVKPAAGTKSVKKTK